MLHLFLYAWLGTLFAWCAQGRLRADGVWAQPAISIVWIFVGFIAAPATLYRNWVYPEWSWLYLIDSADVPGLAIVPVIAASGGALIGGYWVGARILRSDRQKALLGAVVGGGFVIVLFASLVSGRLARPFTDDKFVTIALLTVTIGELAAAAYVGWELWKDGKRALAR